MHGETFLDMRPLKSPRQFFSPFSKSPTPQTSHPFQSSQALPPIPPIPTIPLPPTPTVTPYDPTSQSQRKSHTPSSSASSGSGLGFGATVVRRPSDALRGVQKPSINTAPPVRPRPPSQGVKPHSGRYTKSVEEQWVPPTPSTAPLKYQKSSSPARPARCDAPASASDVGTRSGRQTSTSAREYRLELKGSFSSLSSFASSTVAALNPCEASHASRPLEEEVKRVAPPSEGSGRSDADGEAKKDRRTTARPPLQVGPPPSTTFHALLTSKTKRAGPTHKEDVVIVLDFGYSLDDPPKNSSVVIPWEVLRQAGGHLVNFVSDHLGETSSRSSAPDMTDGSSADESDLESDTYDLNDLLRDEYLKSLFVSSPLQVVFDVPPIPPSPGPLVAAMKTGPTSPGPIRKRAATRNQYTELAQYPSPSSPYMPALALSTRRKAPQLKVQAEETDGGGSITELKVLLTRDAAVYHLIAARMATGAWVKVGARRKRLQDELRWLDMTELLLELETRPRNGGEGYI